MTAWNAPVNQPPSSGSPRDGTMNQPAGTTSGERHRRLPRVPAPTNTRQKKFYEKGNKAAGTRVRKGCQDVKNLCQEIRVDVSNKKNA